MVSNGALVLGAFAVERRAGGGLCRESPWPAFGRGVEFWDQQPHAPGGVSIRWRGIGLARPARMEPAEFPDRAGAPASRRKPVAVLYGSGGAGCAHGDGPACTGVSCVRSEA